MACVHTIFGWYLRVFLFYSTMVLVDVDIWVSLLHFDCLASIVVTVYGQSMILLTIFIRYLHPSLPLLMYMYTSHSHNECFLAPIYIAIHWAYSGCPFLTVVRIIPHLERADLFWVQTLKQKSQMPFVEDLAIRDLLIYRVPIIYKIHKKIS